MKERSEEWAKERGERAKACKAWKMTKGILMRGRYPEDYVGLRHKIGKSFTRTYGGQQLAHFSWEQLWPDFRHQPTEYALIDLIKEAWGGRSFSIVWPRIGLYRIEISFEEGRVFKGETFTDAGLDALEGAMELATK